MKRKRRRIKRNPAGSTGWITLLLAGIGGMWMFSRYREAKKANVSLIEALKAPFDDAAKLAREVVNAAASAANANGGGAPANGKPIPPLPADSPYQPDYAPYDPDATMDPTMLDGGEGE